MKLMINGSDRAGWLQPSSLTISSQLQGRTTLKCVLLTSAGDLMSVDIGSEVSVTNDAGTETFFAGTLFGLTMNPVPGTSFNTWSVEAVDYNELCDRHIAFGVYEDEFTGDIVRDLVDRFMDEESIDVSGVVVEGPKITFALFNYCTVTTAFNQLSEKTGLQWFIGYDKKLHFYERQDNSAPLQISSANNNFRNVQVRRSKSNYRNVQYVRGGKTISDLRTETFHGNGSNKVFSLVLPVAAVPQVTLNGSPQTVGISGVESGKDWYWNKDSEVIQQDFGIPAITAMDTLMVTYQGYFPIVVKASDGQGIQDRKDIEGGSGEYIRLDSDSTIDDPLIATERARGLLRRYASIPEVVTFETDSPGLKAGQLVDINIPGAGINGQYLVDNVVTQDVDGKLLRNKAKVLSGESFGGWVTFFRKLTETTADFVINQDEILIRLLSFEETVRTSDSFNVSTDVDNRVDYAVVGFSRAG